MSTRSSTARFRPGVLAVAPFAFAGLLVACGDDGGSGDDAAFCDRLEALEEANLGDEPDPAFSDDLQELADAAPEDLRDDIQVFIDFNDALVEAGDDPEAQLEAFGEIDEADFEAAGTALEEAAEECGVDTGSGSGSEAETETEE